MGDNKSISEGKDQSINAEEKRELFPAVSMYGPFNIRNKLKPGERRKWCSCGLSKKQPWCDGSHIGTPFKPFQWTVPEPSQVQYELCGCKYTRAPPFCDGTHTSLPLKVIGRKKNCTWKQAHLSSLKLCANCGWVPDW